MKPEKQMQWQIVAKCANKMNEKEKEKYGNGHNNVEQ